MSSALEHHVNVEAERRAVRGWIVWAFCSCGSWLSISSDPETGVLRWRFNHLCVGTDLAWFRLKSAGTRS